MANNSQLKRPRHYAAEIIALRTQSERRDALLRVPDDVRPLVRTYVQNHFSLIRKQQRVAS